MFAGIKMAFEVILGLIMFAGILWLSYFATKNLAKKFSLNGKGGQNLKIIETVSTGRESRLLLVKAGEKFLLIGVTPSNLTLISELSGENIKDFESLNGVSASGTMDFSEALKINIEKVMKKKKSIREEEKNDKKQDS